MTRTVKIKANNGEQSVEIVAKFKKKCRYDSQSFQKNVDHVTDWLHRSLNETYYAREIKIGK